MNTVVDIPASNGLQFPAIQTLLHYDHVFADVEFGTGGSNASFGAAPEVVFEDVTLDLGSFISGFVGPLVNQISDALQPVKPIIDLLTTDVQFLKQLGVSTTSLLDIAEVALGPTKFASVSRGVRAIESATEFVESVKAFDASGGESLLVELGSFTVGGDLRSGQGTPSTDGAKDTQSQVNQNAQKPETKKVAQQFGTTKGSFQFPLISDPLAAFGLLLGKPTDLFLYEMPGLGLNFYYIKSIPVFPGLNARLGGRVKADTNFDFGFNTSGLERWSDGDFNIADIGAVFDGFYIDDHVTFDPAFDVVDGNGVVRTDKPEVTLSSSIIAGASVGVAGLVEAGIDGGVRGEVSFDLNDIPNPTLSTDSTPVYDGRLSVEELENRLSQGPACVFDTRGQISAFLDAFFWVGADLGIFDRATLFEARRNFVNEVLAKFNFGCPDPNATIASLADDEDGDGKVLVLKYEPGPGERLAADQGEIYKVEQKQIRVNPLSKTDLSTHERIVVTSRGNVVDFDPAVIDKIRISGTPRGDE